MLVVLGGCTISSWCTLFFLAFSCPLWGTATAKAKGDNFFTYKTPMLFPKLRPDVASGTSRRDNRRVPTQCLIRRDVILDTSCPDSSKPHLNYRKCFNNDMQYLVMCSENIVRDNPKS